MSFEQLFTLTTQRRWVCQKIYSFKMNLNEAGNCRRKKPTGEVGFLQFRYELVTRPEEKLSTTDNSMIIREA